MILKKKANSPVPMMITRAQKGKIKCKFKSHFDHASDPEVWEVNVNQLMKTDQVELATAVKKVAPSLPHARKPPVTVKIE